MAFRIVFAFVAAAFLFGQTPADRENYIVKVKERSKSADAETWAKKEAPKAVDVVAFVKCVNRAAQAMELGLSRQRERSAGKKPKPMKSAEFLAEVDRLLRRQSSRIEAKWVPDLRRAVGPVSVRNPRPQIEILNRFMFAASMLDEAAK